MEVSLPVAVWSVVGAGAQESWSVDSCMRYALERNLALKNSRLDTRYRSRRLYGGDRRFPAFGQYQRGFRETDGTFGRPENKLVYHLFLRGKYAGCRYIIACLRRIQTYQPGTVHPAEQATEQRCRESRRRTRVAFEDDGCLLVYIFDRKMSALAA